MSNNEEDNAVDTEEDWSSVCMNGFAQHDTQVVNVAPSRSLTIASVAALSPLDMVHLSHGHHDATGHCIWLGAYFFFEALEKCDCVQSLFRSKRVLELGCGSGISGLAVLTSDLGNSLTQVVLTDSDSAALGLCKRNCRQNLPPDARYLITPLEWGKSLNDKFETVLATDVLYDISSLCSLLYTVQASLKVGGYLVLAHVPRASLPGEAKIGSCEKLESFITRKARSYNLILNRTIRPSEMCKDMHEESLNSISFRDMQETGAAILLFQLCDR